MNEKYIILQICTESGLDEILERETDRNHIVCTLASWNDPDDNHPIEALVMHTLYPIDKMPTGLNSTNVIWDDTNVSNEKISCSPVPIIATEEVLRILLNLKDSKPEKRVYWINPLDIEKPDEPEPDLSEIVAEWVGEFLDRSSDKDTSVEKEIEEIKTSIDNETTWMHGASTEEARDLHKINIELLEEYLGWLNWLNRKYIMKQKG